MRWFLPLLLVACANKQPSPTDGLVSTLNLELLSPKQGSPSNPNTEREATFNLTLYDDQGNQFGGDANVDVYISYGGVRTGVEVACGDSSDAPIESVFVHAGSLKNHTVTLPEAYGTTSIWVVERGSNAVGASPPIYFPNPTIPNIQTPPDLAATNASFCTNFQNKFVVIDHATGTGDLVVDSVFGNAITLTDTGATDFRSMYVFVFGQPTPDLVPGRRVLTVNGNISKFQGFTELNFPIVKSDPNDRPDPTRLPAPIPLSSADITNLPKMIGASASVVEITGQVCPVNPPNANNDSTVTNIINEWIKYDTFILASHDCSDSFGEFAVELPAKVVGTFDPTKMVAAKATLRGMLKNSSGQNPVLDATGNMIVCDTSTPCATGSCVGGFCKKGQFNFWTVVVRGSQDVPQ